MISIEEQERLRHITYNMTLHILKAVKNMKKICGFVQDKNRNDFFGNYVCMRYGTNMGGRFLEIFEDRNKNLNDLKKEYDMVILFEHVGNHLDDNLSFKIIDDKTSVITLYTKNKYVMSEDVLKTEFFDEDVIFDIEDRWTGKGYEYIKIPKAEYSDYFIE